jgi:hypothetical protein
MAGTAQPFRTIVVAALDTALISFPVIVPGDQVNTVTVDQANPASAASSRNMLAWMEPYGRSWAWKTSWDCPAQRNSSPPGNQRLRRR